MYICKYDKVMKSISKRDFDYYCNLINWNRQIVISETTCFKQFPFVLWSFESW